MNRQERRHRRFSLQDLTFTLAQQREAERKVEANRKATEKHNERMQQERVEEMTVQAQTRKLVEFHARLRERKLGGL